LFNSEINQPLGQFSPHIQELAEGMKIFKDIWSFDFRRYNQFEHGVIPSTLQKIAEYCTKEESYSSKINLGKDIYYICRNGDQERTVEVIKNWQKMKTNILSLERLAD